jgi:diacylglycerol O-acyltransferase
LAEEPASRTSLDHMVGADRSLALIRTTLGEVKEAGHRHGATVNDVLLSITGGALRALLRGRGEPVAATTVRIYSPVSLRRVGAVGPQQGNLIAQMAVPLDLSVSTRSIGSERSPPKPPPGRRGLARR